MRRAFALACLPLASLVHASEVHWQCALSADLTRLHCVAATATTGVAPGPAATGSAAPPVLVRGTRFPLDTRRTWTVEMWSPADDGEFVAQLARATICYRTPRCHVEVDLGALARRSDGVPASR